MKNTASGKEEEEDERRRGEARRGEGRRRVDTGQRLKNAYVITRQRKAKGRKRKLK